MIRKDLYRIDIQDGLYFIVFHKTFNGGFGSALSVYVNDFEFLKFDCFGIEKGHFHVYDNRKNETIYFSEKICEEQINRIIFELTNNINLYFNKSRKKDIQTFSIDMISLLNKIDIIKNKMLEYESTFYSHLR